MEHPPTVTPEKENVIPALDAPMNDKIAYFEHHPEDIRPEDLNNLRLWLPGSNYLVSLERYMDRKRPAPTHDDGHSPLWQEQTPREYAHAIAQAMAEMPGVAQALEDLKLDNAKTQEHMAELQGRITALYESLRDLPEAERRTRFREAVRPLLEEQAHLHAMLEQQRSVNQALVPLYIALRKKGYSHYDLIA